MFVHHVPRFRHATIQFDTPFVAIQHSLLNGGLEHLIIALIFPITLGISSSQLTNSIIFQMGRYTTSQDFLKNSIAIRLKQKKHMMHSYLTHIYFETRSYFFKNCIVPPGDFINIRYIWISIDTWCIVPYVGMILWYFMVSYPNKHRWSHPFAQPSKKPAVNPAVENRWREATPPRDRKRGDW